MQDAYDKDKHELDGQKYDFVINVDVQEGAPPLKLGCNKTDDPWHVAQNFINKHSLPQVCQQLNKHSLPQVCRNFTGVFCIYGLFESFDK